MARDVLSFRFIPEIVKAIKMIVEAGQLVHGTTNIDYMEGLIYYDLKARMLHDQTYPLEAQLGGLRKIADVASLFIGWLYAQKSKKRYTLIEAPYKSNDGKPVWLVHHKEKLMFPQMVEKWADMQLFDAQYRGPEFVEKRKKELGR